LTPQRPSASTPTLKPKENEGWTNPCNSHPRWNYPVGGGIESHNHVCFLKSKHSGSVHRCSCGANWRIKKYKPALESLASQEQDRVLTILRMDIGLKINELSEDEQMPDKDFAMTQKALRWVISKIDEIADTTKGTATGETG
jgi:hypothetical protein